MSALLIIPTNKENFNPLEQFNTIKNKAKEELAISDTTIVEDHFINEIFIQYHASHPGLEKSVEQAWQKLLQS
jgi:hypothetical protein